jgi:phospholipid-binding lipoprotein MlaA
VAKGYSAVVPKPARLCVRNFFHNIAFPIRFVNCLLQAKFNSAMVELSRFITNSIIGLAGLFDVATTKFDLKEQEEDFGQTLGSYGFGPGFYINWPILGPSSLRDTFGLAGDFFLDPWNQVDLTIEENAGIYAYDKVNSTSLSLGEYEDMKKAALDPYVAFRDAYFHYRKNKIKE